MVGRSSIANAASLELPVLQHGIPNRTGMTGHSFLTIHPFYCYILPSAARLDKWVKWPAGYEGWWRGCRASRENLFLSLIQKMIKGTHFALVFSCPRLLYDSERVPLFLMVWLPSIPPRAGIQDQSWQTLGFSLISQAGIFFFLTLKVSIEPLSSSGTWCLSSSSYTLVW